MQIDYNTMTVTEAAFEFTIEKMSQANKKLIIVIIALIIALIGTNAAWIAYESQYQETTTTQAVDQDTDSGDNRFVGGDYYGAPENYDGN
ncbi:MAG: hypothetical protein IJM02_06685 [Clostridia bacterium]|nr:hypothetical protein [Clostridia bacterium]